MTKHLILQKPAYTAIASLMLTWSALLLTACDSTSQNVALISTSEKASDLSLKDTDAEIHSLPNTNNATAVDRHLTVTPQAEASNRHQTDFLTAGFYTHLYPSFNERRRENIRIKLLESGYTHIYIYIMNQKDYGGPEFDFYPTPESYVKLLSEINDSGLLPVVWLSPDDAPALVKKYTTENLIATWKRVIPVIDPYVDSYVLGLEMDEYWSDSQQVLLGSELNKLTEKTIFVHMKSTVWEQVLQPWADGIIYQYGFGKTPEQITADTKLMLERLADHPDKLFIAGEYSHRQPENESKVLGDAAIEAGALGFGNGGTPFR